MLYGTNETAEIPQKYIWKKINHNFWNEVNEMGT